MMSEIEIFLRRLARATAKDARLKAHSAMLVEALSTRLPQAMAAMVHPCRIVELEEIAKVQALRPFAQCVAAFLHVVCQTHPNALPLHEQLNLAWRSVTWMPLGSEDQSMICLSSVLNVDTLHASVMRTLAEKTSKEEGDEEGLSEEPHEWRRVLLDGFVTTWCGHLDAPLDPSPFSIRPVGVNAAVGSHFPPPPDFLLRRWKTSDAAQKSLTDAARVLLKSQLALVVYLETHHLSNALLSSLSPGEKLQLLIQRVFLEEDAADGSHPFVQRCFAVLVERYIDQGRHRDAFAQWTAAFVEHLLDAFMASGEVALGRVVALVFLDAVPAALKIAAWTLLEANALLHGIPPRHLWYGDPSAYRSVEPSASLRACLATSLANGTLKKAARLQTGLHDWANEILCHVSKPNEGD